MHYEGEKLGQNRGKGHWILTSEETFYFSGPNLCANFNENKTKIAIVEARTDRQKVASYDPIEYRNQCFHFHGKLFGCYFGYSKWPPSDSNGT